MCCQPHNTREKAPFLLFMEVINSDLEDEDRTTEGALSPDRMMSPDASFVLHNPEPLIEPPVQASTSATKLAPPPAEDSFTQYAQSLPCCGYPWSRVSQVVVLLNHDRTMMRIMTLIPLPLAHAPQGAALGPGRAPR